MDECGYCKRQKQHGGDCYGKVNSTPCLLYDKDLRGEWIVEDRWLHVQMGIEIPKVNESHELVFGDSNIDKMVKFYAIKDIVWQMKGEVGIHVKYKMGYWSEENGIVTDKPKLRLVK